MNVKYKFNYFFDRKEEEQYIVIEADNDREAVLMFFDKVGLAEFGCIREDGSFFTDEKFPKLKEIIKYGC
jgi:hypothetical protein